MLKQMITMQFNNANRLEERLFNALSLACEHCDEPSNIKYMAIPSFTTNYDKYYKGRLRI